MTREAYDACVYPCIVYSEAHNCESPWFDNGHARKGKKKYKRHPIQKHSYHLERTYSVMIDTVL